MRIPGSNRFFLNPGEKRNLAWMARNGERVYDLEKEGFSDGESSASLEEISAEDVRMDGRRSRSRAWKDGITGYTIASSFGSNLYSFAWAQAVQNKPLGLEMNSAWDADLEEEKKGGDDVVIGENRDDPAFQMEKEEGELEEGEIDLCSESVAEEQINVSSHTMEDESKHSESETKESEGKEEADMEDLDRRIGEILEELDMVTLEEAEASFEDVCSRLLKSFAGLKTMFVERNFPILDAPVQQAFMGIKTLNSVLCSGNLQKSKQNTDLLLRLLIHIKNQYSMLLTQEQVTEIDIMAQNLVSSDINREKTMPNRSFGASDSGVCLLSIEPPSPLPRNRIEFSPLLDLHADYDEGSLPSPTRGNAQPLPIPKPISFGASVLSGPIACKKDEDEDATLHSYETDALKAVTSYQQKFGRSSVLPSNELPSPTPSEECNHEEDKNDEVSSFSAFGNMVALKDIGSLKSGGSSGTDIIAGTQSASAKMVGWSTTSQPNYVVKAKSRDPRLRLINHNTNGIPNHGLCTNGVIEGQANSKKHRAMDDPVMDDLSLKRQRQSSLIVKDVPLNMNTTVLETNKKLLSNEFVEVGTRKPGIGPAISDSSADTEINSNHNDSNEQNTKVGSAQSVLLPALLKDMGVNPTMLMELLKMEQQRLTVESQPKTSNSSVSNPEVKPPEIGKHQSTKPQIHGQVPSLDSQDNVGRIRMKPRDPRRILHNNKVQKTRVSEHEENKVGAISCDVQYKDRLIVGDSVEQAQTNTVLPRLAPSPPNTWHLTKNIKNSNDGIPSSKSINITQSGPPNCSLLIPTIANKPDGRQFVMEQTDSKAVNTSTSQAVTTDSSHSTNAWEDVDHLLDGYDEQQKAAIQKERTRRIAEQNKMFAARKLCLVLDLDHTLLNSAKFGEVDQLHEEILRIKEEQDRGKPQRHLFRFQHMGMWTKLRPGVWNFLEKASKIFEMHLYTMGNKLYATEMAKVLDPSGTLFAGRVISKGDDGDLFDGDERVPKSKDLDGVLGMESAVVIIDDSVRVWPHNKHNLIVVERYTYFPCSRRQFGLLGPSLLEIDHDERPEDGTLASCLAVIERLHQIFFSHRVLNDVDVRHILATEQRKILAGCRIVFSRVFPVGEANPHLHPLWQTAEQFGAVCTNQIDEQVTHVVANSLGTDKVNWALCTGRFVVHPGWVEASALLYRRANETDFTVKL